MRPTVCARLGISGQNTKKMALECGVTRSTIYNWLKEFRPPINRFQLIPKRWIPVHQWQRAYILRGKGSFALENERMGDDTYRQAHRVRPMCALGLNCWYKLLPREPKRALQAECPVGESQIQVQAHLPETCRNRARRSTGRLASRTWVSPCSAALRVCSMYWSSAGRN